MFSLLLFVLTSRMTGLTESTVTDRVFGKYAYIYNDETYHNWDEAESYCNTVYGTNLASFHSAEEARQVIDHITGWIYDVTTWIGIRDFTGMAGLGDGGLNSSWEWSDGTPYDYEIPWDTYLRGSQDEPKADDCGILIEYRNLGFSESVFLGYAKPCTNVYANFVCNYEAPTKEPTVLPTAPTTPAPVTPVTPAPTVAEYVCPASCNNDPCICDSSDANFEDIYCLTDSVCNSMTGCSQCLNGYWKLGSNYPCVSCAETFGSGCLFCQDSQGCAQCDESNGYTRVYNSNGCNTGSITATNGFWFCQSSPATIPVAAPTVAPSDPTVMPVIAPSAMPTEVEVCPVSIDPCVADKCSDASENPNCPNQQIWGCPQCNSGFFMKNHDFPCVACSVIDHCINCADWVGCTQCDNSYSVSWDNQCGFATCV